MQEPQFRHSRAVLFNICSALIYSLTSALSVNADNIHSVQLLSMAISKRLTRTVRFCTRFVFLCSPRFAMHRATTADCRLA